MSTIDDGGPAFPCSFTGQREEHHGMSLRDWLAGQAMAAIISKMSPQMVRREQGLERVRRIVRGAYDYADAMLAARSQP